VFPDPLSRRAFFFAHTEFVDFYLNHLCKGKNRVETLMFLDNELARYEEAMNKAFQQRCVRKPAP
jgi:hypothetical protein